MRLPKVRKISKLIDALRDYAVNSARALYEDEAADIYHAPRLASWDAGKWFELTQDWELIDFLLADRFESGRLMRSLQALLQWYGQTEMDEILERMSVLSRMN